MFIKYHKIHRLGKTEVEDILYGTCIIQEKIDGANTSIWKEDDKLHVASRNLEKEMTDPVEFNGFIGYVQEHEGVNALLKDHPKLRLYGEWLVKHTIQYKETAYRKWYMFDILLPDDTWMNPSGVSQLAGEYGILEPQTFDCIHNPTKEDLDKYVGESNLGENGEGIVIKNMEFTNKFGDLVYAKVVQEKFMEENAITFGGNNKYSETYWEMYIVNKYTTLARVQKIIDKIQPEINEPMDRQHVPRIMGGVYHDILTEEIWDIQKKVPVVNLKILNRLISKKTKAIYFDILEGNTDRVVYNQTTNGETETNNDEGATSKREDNVGEGVPEETSGDEESK